jgi:hypothetical protein
MANLPSAQRLAAVAEFIDRLKAEGGGNTPAAATGRLIFALDATASREPTWDVASGLTHQMFDAAAGVGALETQLVFYRGFEECKASRWVTNAAELHRIMGQVRCLSGETQISRVLDHALRETGRAKVNALIFIGDACEEKRDALGRPAGELGRLGTPAFMLQEGWAPDATAAFRQIASLSGGAFLLFDLASIDRLRELLGAVAVYAAGGYQALEAYGKKQGGEVLRLTSQVRR